MAENDQQGKGRPGNYKLNKGGAPADAGPFIGIVVNNVDPTRQGRLQVVMQQFSETDKNGTPNTTDKSQWRTVAYCPPFYGSTPKTKGAKGTNSSVGTYPDDTTNAYGMWFTPPDLGSRVLCFFVNGDPSRGFYVACIPEEQSNHMVPSVGGVPQDQRVEQNQNQYTYLKDAPLLPVTEINQQNKKIADSSKFYNEKKPVHSYAASILFQQGVANDPIRGPIKSSSQRESPSACFGIATPGRPVYQGALKDGNIKKEAESATEQGIQVISRRGGHTFIMDDGDLEGKDNLIRIRTAGGHQITMSDDNNSFYIIHANGQTWLEFGQEGTVDVFSTNSVNVRTKGTINLHADKDINMYAGGKLSIKSMQGTTVQSETELNLSAKGPMLAYSQAGIGLKANGTLGIQGKTVSVGGGSAVNLKAGKINLNGSGAVNVPTPKGLEEYIMPDTTFDNSTGWQVKQTGLKSIVSRAPTHEPYPYHNQGVQDHTSLSGGQPGQPPGAPSMPGGWGITKK